MTDKLLALAIVHYIFSVVLILCALLTFTYIVHIHMYSIGRVSFPYRQRTVNCIRFRHYRRWSSSRVCRLRINEARRSSAVSFSALANNEPSQIPFAVGLQVQPTSLSSIRVDQEVPIYEVYDDFELQGESKLLVGEIEDRAQ